MDPVCRVHALDPSDSAHHVPHARFHRKRHGGHGNPTSHDRLVPMGRVQVGTAAPPHEAWGWKSVGDAIRAWLAVRGPAPAPELFLNAWGRPMTRSGFERVLATHVRAAAERRPSLRDRRVSPHVLRHYVPCLTMSSGLAQRLGFL